MTAPYYSDELVTLYHGDCLAVIDWLAADVLVTDPPYGLSAMARGSYGKNMLGRRTKAQRAIVNDETAETRDAALLAWGAAKPAIVFGSWKVARPALTKHRLVWHKDGASPGPLNAAFMSNDEEIYVWGEGFRKSSPPQRTVIRTSEHRSSHVQQIGHPHTKPIGLMELLVERCPPGVIGDPFAGSGATLVAARNLGRKAIGVELDEAYCELIAKRLSQQAFDLEGIA